MSEPIGFILAAGFSSRIKELTKDKPKAFLEIEGKRTIDYHLDNLSKRDIKKTYIVVGFLKNMFKEAIGKNYRGMEIEYIDNDDFQTTNHSYSLFLGRKVFEKSDALVIFADVFCDPALYTSILKDDSNNVVLVDEDYEILTGDELVVEGKEGVIYGMGYKRFDKPNVQGEFVGMNKFSKEFLTELCNYAEKNLETTKKLNYEVLIDNFLRDTGFDKLSYKKIEGKKWININYKEDYETAKKMAEEFNRIGLHNLYK